LDIKPPEIFDLNLSIKEQKEEEYKAEFNGSDASAYDFLGQICKQ
jgi:hypothetical protein